MMAANRFEDRNGTHDPEQEKLAQEVQDFKDEAEKVSPITGMTGRSLASLLLIIIGRCRSSAPPDSIEPLYM